MDVKLMKSLCLLVFLSCGSLYGSSFGRRHHHHSSSNNDQLNKNAVSEYLLNDLQRDSRATTTTAANDDVPKSCPTSTILNVKKHRIIKTNESTKNGASFLDRPPHVESQDQCIAACCKTDQCNLAVFEADGEHSCYLFDCQKPSVCKFVDHDSYSTIDVEYRMIPPATPAAESKPRPPTKKPTSTKPTISDKHEDDLKMIGEKNANDERVEDEENDNDSNDDGDKKPMIDDDGDNKDAIDLPEKTAEVVSTTVMPVVATTTIRKAKSKKRPTLAAPVEEQKFVRPSCGRFQFECLNKNTEIGPTCIAQYDQCDGVEQCLDGSDEEGCDTSEYEQNFSNEVEPAKPFVDEVPNDNEEVTDAQPKTPPSRVRQQHYKPVATKTSETMSKESPSTDYSARERQHTNLMDNDDTSSSDRNSEIDEDNESQNELKQQIVEQSKSEAVHQLDRQHSSNVETPVDNNRNPADSSSDVGDRDRYQDQLSTDIGGGSYLHNDEEDGGGLNRKRPDITDDIDEPSRKPRPLPPRQFTNTDDSQMSSASRQRVQTFGKTVNALATDKNMKDVQDTDVKGRKKVNSDTSSTPHLKASHGKTRKKPDSKTDVDEDKDTKTDTETIPEKVHLAQKAGKKINSIDVETKLKDTSSESQQRISEESGGSTNAKANEHRDTPRPDKPSTAEIDNSNKPSTKLLKQPPNTDKDMTAVVKEKLSSQDTNEKDSREKDNEPESEVAVNTDAPPVANTIKSGSPIKPEVALDDVQGINELSADNIHSQSHSPFDMGSRTAVIALSLGLAIMALLLLIVGCRLRTVKRRLRRGRPLNSNEADYLINGMYL
ncbi:uncharacterized protein LOC141907949 [Tubulanus polymorphus]|uniref:uncharacterized protein LOC141907949 n=1 Tax=Tubulanus polymorphus TaxID=672921 RepID=UPI003DA52774